MATEYFDDEQNLADLVTLMPEKEQQLFNDYGHLRIEAVFLNRVFIVYQPTGLTPGGRHKEPDILTTIKVVGFEVDPHSGSRAVIEDQQTQEQLQLTHVPRKLLAHPVYMSVPPRVTLRWDARLVNGKVWRSLSFAILIKTRNKADFFSKGNTYVETPNTFRRLYPSIASTFTF